MNRKDLQRLAKDRLRDAKTLLANRRWSGAYYLAGYAIECGLKSCVIAHLMRTDKFPDRRFSDQCYTHNLIHLLNLAGLQSDFDAAAISDPQFNANWDIVTVWNEGTRYQRKTQRQAQRLYKAITDNKHGVLRWINSRW